jgi:hypothetical protein
MTTDRLQKSIAKEYMETDMLKMFEHTQSQFTRITFWQILTIILAALFSNYEIVLGTVISESGYKDRCRKEMENA